MKSSTALSLFGASCACLFSAYADVIWKGSVSGDLAVGDNWDGGQVPLFNEGTKTGEGAVFNGDGPVSHALTLGSDLYINSLLMRPQEFKSAYYYTSWDFNLSGKRLRLYGDYNVDGNHAVYVNGGNQSVLFQNGTLDFTGALANTEMMVMVTGGSSSLAFAGVQTTVSGCPSLRAFNFASLMITNGVTATGYFRMSRDPLIRIAGIGTVVDSQGVQSKLGAEGNKTTGRFELLDGAEWKNVNGAVIGDSGYNGTMIVSNASLSSSVSILGVGANPYASNNVLRIMDGAKVTVNTKTPVNKGCITVGNGFNNLLEVSGATTELTSEGLTDGGSAIVRVGEFGFFNTFRVTDHAALSFDVGTLVVGMNESGVYRGDSVGNRAVVDGGASLSVQVASVGAVMNRSDYLVFRHRDFSGGYREDNADTYLHSCSNMMEVSGTGSAVAVSGALSVSSQGNLNYDAAQEGNGVKVTDSATLKANTIAVGTRGTNNFLTVGAGASVTSVCQTTIGSSISSGSSVNVAGGSLRVHNNYYRLYLKGASSADNPARLSVSNGGDAYAYYLQMEGHNNCLSISNGTVSAAAGLYFPFNAADDDQTFEFAGTNSVLKMTATSDDFWFRGKTKFVFRIPAEGYCAVPIQGGNNVEISGTPTVEIDARDYFARPSSITTVLVQSGKNGRLSVSAEALESLNNSAKPYGCSVKLMSNNKQLVLKHHLGMVLICR